MWRDRAVKQRKGMMRWAAEERSMLSGEDQTPEDTELSSWEGAVVISRGRQMPALFLLPGLLGTTPTGVTRELILLRPARMTEPSWSHLPFLIRSWKTTLAHGLVSLTGKPSLEPTHLGSGFSTASSHPWNSQLSGLLPITWGLLDPSIIKEWIQDTCPHTRCVEVQVPDITGTESTWPVYSSSHRLCHPTSTFHTQYNTNAIWILLTLY